MVVGERNCEESVMGVGGEGEGRERKKKEKGCVGWKM
jgi:hypothetical protein